MQATPKSPRRRRQTPSRQVQTGYAADWQQDRAPWPASTPRRGQPTPKASAPKSPARQQPKTKKPAKKQSGAPAPEPDWESEVAPPSQVSTSAASSTVSPEAQQLRELMAVLKKSDQELSAEIQAVMSRVKVITPKEASKLMHGAVSRLDTAREKLQKARNARSNMHRNWSKFLSEAIQRWQQHSEKFAKEDGELQKAIELAATVFQNARSHLEETKEALSEFGNVIENVQEVSDEELMLDAPPSLANGIQEMLTSLTRLRDTQDEPENLAKKPRLAEAAKEEPGNASLPRAMQPVGMGDK